ncbi:MAG: LuxR C-terminal-related transcriptional regulator [Gordonia sp. (in: high G+C Gram-positive bacteria)]|uniref:helix-turn-helix transcriptional regulator n=1 Tax=Gordonia sp. (in: high G+C Gram-positive bacteria) TaxID=84139 RepID=UPI003BB75D1B
MTHVAHYLDAARAAAAESILIETKTHVPQWRTGSVSRAPIVGAARRSGAQVVTVTAPAGYGKSTLLAEWAATEDRPVRWVGFDWIDDEAGFVLALIASAVSEIAPLASAVESGVPAGDSEVLGRSVPLLAAALSRAPEPFVLILDDLHRISSEACGDVLEVLLGAVPEGSQVICAGRSAPAFLARLRLHGSSYELDAPDLRLDRMAARQIFSQAGACGVSDSELDRVVELCEGWASGLHLSALLASSGVPTARISGQDVYVADYLHTECLRRLPRDLQDFLRRTAVLERMSASLCNDLLGIDDSCAYLRRLEDANLFLVPLDHERAWFRYHALFRGFLLADLERTDGAQAVAALHRAAAQWLRDHAMTVEAVEHLLQAGDQEQAAELISAIALPLYQRGRIALARDWFRRLGDPVIRRDWRLAVLVVWSAMLLGEVLGGENWSRELQAIDEEAVPADDRESFRSARAMIDAAGCPNGYRAVTIDARLAVDSEAVDSPWRGQALHLLGSAQLLCGDAAAARTAFEEAIVAADRMDNSDTVILSEPELALMDMAIDDWAGAAAHADCAVARIEAHSMHGYSTTALALAVAARIALHRGDTERGGQLLTQAMRARSGCTYLLPWLSIRVRLQLAKAYVSLGDRSAARQLVREIDDLQAKRAVGGALDEEVTRFRAGLERDGVAGGAALLTPAELRLLPYLQTHLTIAEIGGRLFVSRNTASSQVSSIYRKLAVNSRSSAVARATELGLLGS